MAEKFSQRLLAIIDALPLRPGMRILEIGCGPGAMAREIVRRVEGVFVLGLDRSDKAIEQAVTGSSKEIRAGNLEFRVAEAGDFKLKPKEKRFDLAVAIRVGALDGRHPEQGILARKCIAKALKPGGLLYIDGGKPLKKIKLRE